LRGIANLLFVYYKCGGKIVSEQIESKKELYKVVINHEEQYSIWPYDKENALGWNDEGKIGTKEECLSYIDGVWTDMRPLSLRIQMEEISKTS
jgi:MbtH protein